MIWIIKLLVMLFILFLVGQYSYYWDSQANPRHGSTVFEIGGQKYHGDVSRTWKGDYRIIDDKGSETIVASDNFVAAAYPSYSDDHLGWRFLFPPLLLLLMWLMKDLMIFMRVVNRAENH